jgi:hypothetical protein
MRQCTFIDATYNTSIAHCVTELCNHTTTSVFKVGGESRKTLAQARNDYRVRLIEQLQADMCELLQAEYIGHETMCSLAGTRLPEACLVLPRLSSWNHILAVHDV